MVATGELRYPDPRTILMESLNASIHGDDVLVIMLSTYVKSATKHLIRQAHPKAQPELAWLDGPIPLSSRGTQRTVPPRGRRCRSAINLV